MDEEYKINLTPEQEELLGINLEKEYSVRGRSFGRTEKDVEDHLRYIDDLARNSSH